MIGLANGQLGRPAEVLLVEDNQGDELLAVEALRTSKVANNLSVARDGVDALRLLRREGEFAGYARPDLVLLDLSLPRMDGREVLSAMKADPSIANIPVVVMTSSRAEIDIVQSYQLKASSYIVKPVTFERLTQVVAAIEGFWFTVVVLPPHSPPDINDAL